MRGRESKDPRSKQWGISYRAFRDHWILLLLKVNEKVFARSEVREIPYIDPVRDLKTQFQQGITQHKARKNKEFKLVLPFREPVIQKQFFDNLEELNELSDWETIEPEVKGVAMEVPDNGP